MKPGLYVIGTPIGNLGDISNRALDILASVDFILAEDTRHTQKLLSFYKIKVPTISCHKFNEASRTKIVIRKIKDGKAVALVTNAGMPCVSDPGARIVKACVEEKLFITAIPGPSSITMAISLCGFLSTQHLFLGFLPSQSSDRKKFLSLALTCNFNIVIFESPYRIIKLLEELCIFFPKANVFIGRELTKINEECLWGTPQQLLATFMERINIKKQKIKGEFVLVIDNSVK